MATVRAGCEKNSRLPARAAGLQVNGEHSHAELGYWIGRPLRGIYNAWDAAPVLVEHGFFGLDFQRVHARHLARNRAPARVLSAVGFRHEGTLEGHAMRWGTFHDVEVCRICAADYLRDYVSRRGMGRRDGGDGG